MLVFKGFSKINHKILNKCNLEMKQELHFKLKRLYGKTIQHNYNLKKRENILQKQGFSPKSKGT